MPTTRERQEFEVVTRSVKTPGPVMARNVNRLRVYSTGAVARMFGVAPRTASKWLDSGKIQGYRIPGSQDRRCTAAALVEFCRQSRLEIPAELLEAVGPRLLYATLLPPEAASALPATWQQVSPFRLGADLGTPGTRAGCILVGDAEGRAAQAAIVGQVRSLRPDFAVVWVISDPTVPAPARTSAFTDIPDTIHLPCDMAAAVAQWESP